ncbi:MAG: 16S rRNA (uracil(1498)-N(3))-methyltransferase [Nitrospirae bacterium]|nr:16S rRNA (uracil(1498)-N(3))-methyltransferase [Nitrospirota bacterium]
MSKPPRFFIAPDQVRDPSISVMGEDVRHIRTVLRKGPGDLLTLLDGQGREYTVRITTIERSKIEAQIIDRKERTTASPVVILGQGLPKSDKMDWIVQKATELGVSAIVPLVTERTIVKIKDEEKRVARWQKICREAAMQSGRPDIPMVEAIRPFCDFVGTLAPVPQNLLLFPWEEGTQPVKEVLRGKQGIEKVAILIGPEGGFSQAEADLAKQEGFHLVSLGPNILRAETAAVAVLSMVLYETNA